MKGNPILILISFIINMVSSSSILNNLVRRGLSGNKNLIRRLKSDNNSISHNNFILATQLTINKRIHDLISEWELSNEYKKIFKHDQEILELLISGYFENSLMSKALYESVLAKDLTVIGAIMASQVKDQFSFNGIVASDNSKYVFTETLLNLGYFNFIKKLARKNPEIIHEDFIWIAIKKKKFDFANLIYSYLSLSEHKSKNSFEEFDTENTGKYISTDFLTALVDQVKNYDENSYNYTILEPAIFRLILNICISSNGSRKISNNDIEVIMKLSNNSRLNNYLSTMKTSENDSIYFQRPIPKTDKEA